MIKQFVFGIVMVIWSDRTKFILRLFWHFTGLKMEFILVDQTFFSNTHSLIVPILRNLLNCVGWFLINYRGYYIRLHQFVIGWHTLECNIWFWVRQHWSSTFGLGLNQMLHSNVCQPVTKWHSLMWNTLYKMILVIQRRGGTSNTVLPLFWWYREHRDILTTVDTYNTETL